MVRSLRSRLLLWYTAILALVVSGFGAGIVYVSWCTRLAEIDLALRQQAGALASSLHPIGGGRFDLALPRADFLDDSERTYHVLWDSSGETIDRSDPDLDIARPPETGALTRHDRREFVMQTDSGATILVGRHLARARAELWPLAVTTAVAGAIAIALSLVGGWWLVGRALAPLYASLHRQRRFTADASHELRTPLATISTEAQWALARDRSPDELRASFEASHRAATRMQGVVDRLLALAREESDELEHAVVPVRLDSLLEETTRDLMPLALKRGLNFSLETAPVAVVGDPRRLREAVSHLVANAIQYNADHGQVRVCLRRDGQTAEVRVIDDGPGIAPTDLPRVFEPFFRADAARSRDAGGAGLGLAVSRAIVRRHGGDLTCDSAPGRGTTMTIRMPAE